MLRSATYKDLPFIRQLAHSVFSQFGDYERILSHFFYSAGVTTFIWELNHAPVALAMVERIWDRRENAYYADLLAIAVAPAHQAKGLGGLLLNSVIEWATEAGAASLWLSVADTNTTAQRFFTNHGFVLITQNDSYYPGGQRAFRMARTLGA